MVAVAGAPAFASAHHGGPVNNAGNTSVLSGDSVYAPVAILGVAEASCNGGASVFLTSLNGGW
jgi:hypothetical protein